MPLFCPSCSKEIVPETTQCFSCNATYDLDALKFLKDLFRRVSQEYLGERRKQARIPTQFRVAYATTSGFSGESYTFDFSLGGLFIETNEPPSQGEEIHLKISLPDKEEKIEVVGEIAWIKSKEGAVSEGEYPPGVGIKFLNLSQEKIEELISILRQAVEEQEKEAATYCPFCSKEIQPETTQCPWCGCAFTLETLDLSTSIEEILERESTTRRNYIRVPHKFKVAYSTSEELVESYLSDISLGGLFIKTDSFLEKGETIELEISLPDGGKALRVVGEVIWSIREELETSGKKIPRGMGVKFLNLSTENRIRLSINILKH